jgi:hypothetical protein
LPMTFFLVQVMNGVLTGYSTSSRFQHRRFTHRWQH